jgi:hypothetical protein
MPPALFTVAELRTIMGNPSLSEDTANLALSLVTIEIRRIVGPATYDALTDVTAYKLIALQLAKRIVFNPTVLKSERVDDYEYTVDSGAIGAAELTADEIERILKIAGKGGPFSIKPGYPSPTFTDARYGERW